MNGHDTGNAPRERKTLGWLLVIAAIVAAFLILRNDVFGQDKPEYSFTMRICKEIVDSVWVCPRHDVIERHWIQPDSDCVKVVEFHESNLGYLYGRPFCGKC